jgi:fimbrial chaperone protein
MSPAQLIRRGFLLLVSMFPLLCGGYTLDPPLATLRSAGSQSSTFFRLRNVEARAAAIEISIHEHRKDLDGNGMTREPAENSFIVYPEQLVMIPGDEVSVQVRWIGDAALPAERAYTLVAREVAIPGLDAQRLDDTPGMRVQVAVLVNYEARLYVTPPGARPRVIVESVAELPADADGGPALEVILGNEGNAHQNLEELSFLLLPVDASDRPLATQGVRVAATAVRGTRPHLLAGDRRRLKIPRPGVFPAGRVHVQLAR